VVADDGASGVDEVVRGDDLASSAPRQAYLARLLGIREPAWVHVPLAVNSERKRLAKRDGAVTYQQLCAQGGTRADVVAWLPRSLGLAEAGGDWTDIDAMVGGADFDRLGRAPAIFIPPAEPA